MANMECKLFVSAAGVKNPQAVNDILSKHFKTIGLRVVEKGGAYQLVGGPWEPAASEPNDYKWPQAARAELFKIDVPDADALARHVLDAHGDQGLIDLLLALAPHLKSSLTIQAVRGHGGKEPIRAQEWHVEPGATRVETTAFKHTDDTEDRLPQMDFVASNRAEVEDPEAVERLLSSHAVTFDAVLRGGDYGAFLSIRGEGEPAAVNLDKHNLREAVRASDAVIDAYLESVGEEGFVELLRDLAPHLMDPLTVQHFREDDFAPPETRQWHVRPGATEIEVTTLKQPPDDDDQAEAKPDAATPGGD